ncbi:hypothetical protein DXG01_006832 [Tephrocybe rancida]|nr:hypothetical protein DXG01_006832 [Tephrocybe rancida]
MATVAHAHDVLSEQLIAQLLQEDLNLLESFRQAEKLQLDQVMATSARAQGRIPTYSKQNAVVNDPDNDAVLAFEMYVADARVSSDAAYAQTVQNEAFTANTVDWQFAQRLAANERKFNLDAEFARRLQAMDDEGRSDIDNVKDAESIFGDKVMARDLNAPISKDDGDDNVKPRQRIKIEDEHVNPVATSKDKGKGRQLSPAMFPDNREVIKYSSDGFSIKMEEDEATSLSSIPYSTCNICMEAFTATNSPINAALSANSSTKLQFGLCLPCPKNHAYCISCLTSYIQSKLDPDGRGVGKSGAAVFPIRCPECPLIAWPEGIDDGVARKVLGEDGMVEWMRTAKTLKRLVLHVHKQYVYRVERAGTQALPLDERSPEDRAVLDLAKAQHWRRCPNCSVIVEHVFGCNHMTCRCGFHFCFKCGSPSTTQGKCKRDPPCELWDEEMLLEQRERERNHQAAAPRAIQQQAPPRVARAMGAYVYHPPEPEFEPPAYAARAMNIQPVEAHDDLHWIDNPGMPFKSVPSINSLKVILILRYTVRQTLVYDIHDS